RGRRPADPFQSRFRGRAAGRQAQFRPRAPAGGLKKPAGMPYTACRYEAWPVDGLMRDSSDCVLLMHRRWAITIPGDLRDIAAGQGADYGGLLETRSHTPQSGFQLFAGRIWQTAWHKATTLPSGLRASPAR